MWKFLTGIFFVQIAMVTAYALAIQHIYVDHDVMHGATFPPFWWMKFLTHPLSDFINLPWEEFVLEHNRHHASTVDLLTQGEFGWDPEMPLYWLGKPGKNRRTLQGDEQLMDD